MTRSIAPQAQHTHSSEQDGESRKQVRGSTLLLMGRCIALLINLAVQVITVRYLAKEEYGAFAFGISMLAAEGAPKGVDVLQGLSVATDGPRLTARLKLTKLQLKELAALA